MSDLGVTHFRPVIRWSDVQSDASSHCDWTKLDALFEEYRERGARALVLLNSGSAPWATDQGWVSSASELCTDFPPRILPALDEPIAGDEPYYIFVSEAVERYRDVAAAWLIDNEPSEPWSWAADAGSYARMARLGAAAVHDADPEAVAVLGAIPAGTMAAMAIADRLDDPTQEEFIVSFASRMWGYPLTIDEIRRIFDAPAFRVWDRVDFFRQALAVLPEMDALAGNVLGIHARGHLAEDLAWAYADQMQTHGGGERPLIYTEINPYLADETALAQETSQLMIASLETGMLLGQAYHGFVDDSVERMDEPNSGLVTKSLEPKTGYYAYRTLVSLLDDATEAGSVELAESVTAYQFRDDTGLTIYAFWATDAVELDLREVVGPSSVALVDMVGDPVVAGLDRVPVSPSPTYAIIQGSYTLSLAKVGSGSAKVNGMAVSLPWSGELPRGSDVTLQAVPDEGWRFNRWSGDLSGSQNPTAITINDDWTITAKFAEIEYDLSITGVGAGAVTLNGNLHSLPWSGEFYPGSQITVEAVPDSGWEFGGWLGDLSGESNLAVFVMDGDRSITATFVAPDQFQLTVTKSGSGSVQVDGVGQSLPWSGPFANGAQVTVEAVADADGQFVEWSGDVTGSANPITLTMDSDKNIEAEFACTTGLFSDVPCDHWAAEAIAAVHDADIASGYSDGSYLPHLAVTRASMAVFLARGLAGGTEGVPAGPE
ncbi:MAG: S-layer homology domain-containing protein, partial [Armatimonadetes bacterium]|nr:S-layer homology domain-containing protein [Armatimonadota bacterium]